MLDSVALQQVERRLTARMARVARAEAAALLPDTTTPTPRHPAPVIEPDLLGTIEFAPDSLTVGAAALERVRAVAQMAAQLSGRVELVANSEGTGALALDAALMRARQVYQALLAAEPKLSAREAEVSVRTHLLPPGATAARPTVQVFLYSGQ